jgi:hypothetical protein
MFSGVKQRMISIVSYPLPRVTRILFIYLLFYEFTKIYISPNVFQTYTAIRNGGNLPTTISNGSSHLLFETAVEAPPVNG